LLVVEFTSLSVKLAHNRREIESTFVDYLVVLAIARWLKALLVNIARHQPEVKSYRDQIGVRLVGPIVGGIGWTRIAVRLVPVWLRRLLPVLVPVGGFMILQRRVPISPWELSSGCLSYDLHVVGIFVAVFR
jgi:hypothetical protein